MSEELVRLQTIEFKQEIEKRFAKSRHNHNYVFEREGNDFSDDDSLDSLKNIGLYNLCKPIRNKSMETERTMPKTSKTLLIRLLKPKNNHQSMKIVQTTLHYINPDRKAKMAPLDFALKVQSFENQKCNLNFSQDPQKSFVHSSRQFDQISKNQHLYKLNNYSMAV